MTHTEDDFSRLEINLNNCLDNYKYFRKKLEATTKLLVLVKANAYGHGGKEFASLVEEAGADYLAVAYPIEGVELRRNGINLPILVLTAGTDSFDMLINNRLEPCIPNMEAMRKFCKCLEKRKIENYPTHIKLDSGMHRLGFMTSELKELVEFLPNSKEVKIESIYSHLAVANEVDQDEFTMDQIEMFLENADKISSSLGYKPMYHILNSAGIERFPQYQLDMVRLGIGIYGISDTNDSELKPVASFKTKIIQIKNLQPEDGTIGYGRNGHIAQAGTIMATIPVGYADGVDRRLGCGNFSFSINGKRVPTIGNICMDMLMLDITGVEAKVGDTVTIFGDDPSVNELADKLGTIPYEIFTSVPRRIKRTIID